MEKCNFNAFLENHNTTKQQTDEKINWEVTLPIMLVCYNFILLITPIRRPFLAHWALIVAPCDTCYKYIFSILQYIMQCTRLYIGVQHIYHRQIIYRARITGNPIHISGFKCNECIQIISWRRFVSIRCCPIFLAQSVHLYHIGWSGKDFGTPCSKSKHACLTPGLSIMAYTI